MKLHYLLPAALGALLAGCASSDAPKDWFSSKLSEFDSSGAPIVTGSTGGQQESAGTFRRYGGAVQQGTDHFVAQGEPGISLEKRPNGGEGYSINLLNAPVAFAAKSVLGDILKVSYIVDSRVNGTVTLQTSQPVSKESLVGVFESALALNGTAIIKKGDTYQIMPANEALLATPAVNLANAVGPGVKVLTVELKYIGADEMKSILEPMSRPGAILRADSNRNLLVLAGTGADLAALQEAISTFDVDWMKGMSVGLYPLKASQPAAVAKELGSIFSTQNGPGEKIIRFIPNERLNAVLAITSRRNYLTQAAGWIEKLDRLASTNEERVFVYNIQNRPAKELAQILQSVLAGQSAAGMKNANDTVAPDLEPVTLASGKAAADPQIPDTPALSPSMATQGQAVRTSVVADTENNALLISSTAREYERIERILKKLDVMPTQILIEAVIAEVTLNDELKFGLRWYFERGNNTFGLSDLATGAVSKSFPGFAWSFATSDARVTLNALSSVTNVNIVSAPTLMALNNQKATLQVGDQVPIVTQQSNSTLTNNSAVINSIELKDTGIILTVVPRISSSNRVLLDIQQEVSNVVKTTSSGIDSPTIQQRKLSTRVIVGDNESLTLGGLIQQRNSLGRSHVPVLGNIPVLGNAFKSKEDMIGKTELIIFIKPRIVRDIRQARAVTEEYRNQLDFSSPIKKVRGGRSGLEQDLKRLAN